MQRFLRAVAVLTAALLLVLCLPSCQDKTLAGRSFYFPLDAEPRQLDPQVSTDRSSMTVAAALFEGLTRLDENGKAVPAAAQWTVSEDRMTYTFTLRESQWSNGEPVTADDFLFGMQRAVQPSTRSSLASQLFDIVGAEDINEGRAELSSLGVKVQDDRTLIITLREPNDAFPERVASTPFMPCNRAFFESTGGKYGLEKDYVLTNGPFMLSRWSHGEYLVIKKHEGYHDQESILPAAVRYVIGQVEDPVTSLAEGNLDAAEISPSQVEAAREENLQLVPLEDTISYLWMNNTAKGLKKEETRRALREALQWDALTALIGEAGYTVATGYTAPAAVLHGGEPYRTEANGLVPETVGGGTVTAAQAQQHLAEGMAAEGLTTLPKMTLLCADDEFSQNLARYILQSWQKNLGLYFTMEALPEAELETRVRVGNYELALCASQAEGLTALEALGEYASSSTHNLARFSDADYDVLYESARTGDTTREKLERLEAALQEACPCVPLFFKTRYFALAEEVSGMVIRPFGGGAFGAEIDFRGAGKPE